MKITSCSSREAIIGQKQQLQLGLDQKQKQTQYQQVSRAQSCRVSTDSSIQANLPRINNNNNQHYNINSFKRINTQVISCHNNQQQISIHDSNIRLLSHQDNHFNNNYEEVNPIRKISNITQSSQHNSLIINKLNDEKDKLQVSSSEITGWDNSEENTTASQMELDNLQEYYQRTQSQRNLKQISSCNPITSKTPKDNLSHNNNNDIQNSDDHHSSTTPRKKYIKSIKNPSNNLSNSNPSKSPRKLIPNSILRQRMSTQSSSSPSLLHTLVLPDQIDSCCTSGLQLFKESDVQQQLSNLQVIKQSQNSAMPLSAKPQSSQQSSTGSQPTQFFSSLLLQNDRLLDNRKKSLAQFHIIHNMPESHDTISTNKHNQNKIVNINNKKIEIFENNDQKQQSQITTDSINEGNDQILTNQSQDIIIQSPKKLIKYSRKPIEQLVSHKDQQQSPRKYIPENNLKYIPNKDSINQRHHSTTQSKNHNYNRQYNTTTTTTSQNQSSLRFYDTPVVIHGHLENPNKNKGTIKQYKTPPIQDNTHNNTLQLPSSPSQQLQNIQQLSPSLIPSSKSQFHPQLSLYGFPVVIPNNHLSSLILPPKQEEQSQLSQTIDLQPNSCDVLPDKDNSKNYSNFKDPISSPLKGITQFQSNKLMNKQQKSMEYLQRQFENKSQQKHKINIQSQITVEDNIISENHRIEGIPHEIQSSQSQEKEKQDYYVQQQHEKQNYLSNRSVSVNRIVTPRDNKNILQKGQEFSDSQFSVSKDFFEDKGKEEQRKGSIIRNIKQLDKAETDLTLGTKLTKNIYISSSSPVALIVTDSKRFSSSSSVRNHQKIDDNTNNTRIQHNKLIFYPEKLQQSHKYQEQLHKYSSHSQHTPHTDSQVQTTEIVHSEYYPNSLSQCSFQKIQDNNNRSDLIVNEQIQQQQQEHSSMTAAYKSNNNHQSSQSPIARNVVNLNIQDKYENVSFSQQIRKIMETQRHQRQIKVLERQFQSIKQAGVQQQQQYSKQQSQSVLPSQGLIRKGKTYGNNQQPSLQMI